LAHVSEVLTVFISSAFMMEAVSISETSVNFYEITLRNIPEDSHLYQATSVLPILSFCLQCIQREEEPENISLSVSLKYYFLYEQHQTNFRFNAWKHYSCLLREEKFVLDSSYFIYFISVPFFNPEYSGDSFYVIGYFHTGISLIKVKLQKL
jgi:hypothetical protein